MEKSSETFQMGRVGEKSAHTLIVLGGLNLVQARSVEYYNEDLNTWTKLLDLDIDIRLFKSVVLDGKLILVGGYDNETFSAKVQSYDFLNGNMTVLAPINEPRYSHGLVVLARHLFVIGGVNGPYLNSVERYDPITDTWTEIMPMPTARSECGVTVHRIDDEIYVIGGQNSDILSVVEAYNPVRGTWRKCASMNETRVSLAVASIDNFIYAVGGYDGNNTLNTAERYEPLIDRWTNIEAISVPRFGCEGVNYNDYMIVAGGQTVSENEKFTTVESYKNDQWSTITPLVTARSYFSLVDVPWSYIKQAQKINV